MGGNSLANREKGEATCHQAATLLSLLETLSSISLKTCAPKHLCELSVPFA